MATSGTIGLKMRYLGDGYVGQELCYCVIDVALNCITVHRVQGGTMKKSEIITDPGEVEKYKSVFRAFFYNPSGCSGWNKTKIPGGARFTKYYPSVSWNARTGVVRWLVDDGAF